ncbi:polysaccharide export protein [Sphingomonas sp. LB-2]|uniref:polysaccharide biosynthesis/export family protein n=1 Tax=Sphingomonas caeni TaxID=2984949 RepID=UPI00222E365C|nr:polysaccharide biosynthesis/export family protein [Sphingomonas caeni]MCW3845609.1 polysaccharide export protein [Sphingomonas caeni]
MTLRSGLALAAGCLMALALSACGNRAPGPIGQAPGMQVAQLSDLPRPSASDRMTENEPYLLGPLDKLEVEVYGVPDLKRTVTVDANGTFAFPLVGEVQASGLTPSQISLALAGKLNAYIKNPQVTVNVLERVSQNLTVDGQVARPGQYPVVGRQTLMRAVAIAGGTTEYAKLDDVVIFRTVQGQRYVGLYNLGAIRRGNYPDPEIFANDIIIVGDSAERRRFQDILQAMPVLTAPLILLTQAFK